MFNYGSVSNRVKDVSSYVIRSGVVSCLSNTATQRNKDRKSEIILRDSATMGTSISNKVISNKRREDK